MDYLASIRSDSGHFRDLLAAVEGGAPVPCCPEWTATDLAWHLAEVQWFWGTIVAGRLSEAEEAEENKPDRPAGHDQVLKFHQEASNLLIGALATADDDEPVWTWHSDQTVGFVRRRQAHEAMIHRVDAQRTAGSVPRLDPALAADGIDEILRVMIGGVPEWASFEPDGSSVRIRARDTGQLWGFAFGRMRGTSPVTAKTYDLDAATVGLDAPGAQASVEASAEALDLWLWGRAGTEDLDLAGDSGLIDRLRTLAAESTQ